MKMGEDFPPELPSYINVYFTVEDCDAAVAKATSGAAKLRFGPMDSPFGRFAALTRPAGCGVLGDRLDTTKGEMPKTSNES